MQKKYLVLILTMLVIVFLLVVYLVSYSKSKVTSYLKTPLSVVSSVSSSAVIADMKTRKYEELIKLYPDYVTGPNLLSKELVDEFNKVLKPMIQEHKVIFNDASLEPSAIQINQGDFVTWVNSSTNSIEILSQDKTWKTYVGKNPGQSFSQAFHFLGDYPYVILIDGEIVSRGVVTVK